MATVGFDDLLAAYGMPDMATILADDKQPIMLGADASPTANKSKDNGKDHVDTGINSPPFPLMASAAAPRMASPTKGTPNHNYQRFSGVSQVSRNSPIWNSVPPGKPKLPQTSRKSVSQRRPKARGRANSRPYTYPDERQMYQSFNITDPTLTPSGPSAGQNVMVGQQFRSSNQSEPHSAAHKFVSLIQHMEKPKPDNPQNGTNTSNSIVLSIPYGNTLLSKANPLPPYKPPKPPPHLKIPDTRFLCTVCDDTFMFPSSLESHMKRRSIFLKFDCNICQKQVVFYNKCAFHRHIQDHLAVNEQVKVDKADLKFESLSFDVIKEGLDSLSVFSPDFNVDLGLSSDEPIVLSSETAPSPEVGSVGKAADHPLPESAQGGQLQVESVEGIGLQKPISSDILGKYCWECSATFKTKEEFTRHWTSGWEFPSKHDCHRCGLVMPTACSLKAHARLSRGNQGAPHVCPECGELFDGKNSLDDHTRFQCFHYARTVTYPCPYCRQTYTPKVCKRFNDRDAFVRHLMNHSDNYYKCKCCPMAFKSEAGLYGHCVATHAKEDAIQSPQLMIHKCPLCNTVFHQSTLLTTHMHWHFEEIEKTRGYEFVCPFCMVKFGSNKSLKEHAWTAHKTLMSEKMASISAISEKGASPAVTSEKRASVSAMSERGATTVAMSEKGASTASAHSTALAPSLGRPRKKRPDVVVTPPDESSKVTPPSKAKGVKTTDVVMKTTSVKEKKLNVKPKKKKQVKAMHKNAGPKYILSAPGEETAAGSGSRPASALSSPILSEPDADGTPDSETSATIKGQYAPYECPICHLQYYYRDSLFKHRRVHEKEGKFICLLCSEVFNNKMAQVQHTRICFRIKKGLDSANAQVNMFTCEICDETFFCQDELQKHMQDLHSISVLQQFACLLCGLTYDEKASLEQHIEETHKGCGKKPTYMCWICQDERITKGFGKRHLLEKHLQKEHKISKNQIDYSRMTKPTAVKGAGEDEVSPQKEDNGDQEKKRSLEGLESNGVTSIVPKRLKVEGDSIYNCAKCKFSSANRKEFQKHIIDHKNSRDGIQCLECGMCFIVEPSLRKHLFIVHKIKDYEKYVSELGGQIPLFTETEMHDVTGFSEVPEKVSLSPESNPLECKVCYRVFEEEARLKNHMRTHGMAFIRSKRVNASPKKVSPHKAP
ncbi:zinc finger protein 687a-like [Lineus longissimus]|uniref:zinc finger protein 687a-like n=1 Tax=Lineus longissimus TaxID=88925 RepID=UPI002B4CA72A